MDRNATIQNRTDAIMRETFRARDWNTGRQRYEVGPFAMWETQLRVRASALRRVLRSVGHWAYVLTVGTI